MRLLLIRHGQTPSNVAGALDTAFPGAGLTPLGRAQAQAVPGALAAETVAGVYASRLVRTQLTAAPLASALGVTVEVRDGFEEVSAGEHELRTEPEAVQAYTGCLLGWMLGDLARRMPGGESGVEFLARFEAAVEGVVADHVDQDTVAVFSHGAAIRVFTTLAAGLAPEAAQELRILNTGMSVLEGSPGAGWELVDWSSEPLGGLGLEDALAHDVTGESVDEVER